MFKNYSVDCCKEALKQLDFSNYKTFDDVDGDYSNIFQKIVTVTEKITPYRNKRIKGNNKKWFDRKVLEKLNARDKLSKKFKKSTLNIDKQLYRKAIYDASKLITKKKIIF